MTVTSRRNLLCLVWTAVGLLLCWRALPYLGLVDDPSIEGLRGANTWIALAAAVPLGIGKGFTALRSAARRAATHIDLCGDRAPAWTAFNLPMLGLIAFFVGVGYALRLVPYDRTVKAWVVGILYPAIGIALGIGGQIVRGTRTRSPGPSNHM